MMGKTDRTTLTTAALFGLMLLCVGAAQAELKYLQLHVGSVKPLQVGTVEKVAVGNDEVLSVSVMDNGEVLLIPKAPGGTDLYIWKPGERKLSYRINVLAANVHQRAAVLRSVLNGFGDLEVRTVDNLLIVEGELPPEDMELYTRTVSRFPEVVSLVKPAPLSMRDLIKIKVQVLEVDKQYRKQLGIRWADTADGPIIGGVGSFVTNDVYRLLPENDNIDWSPLENLPPNDSHFYPFAGFATALLSQIQLIEENGAGRTLAEPTLTTRSGEPASFHAGGEIPYAVLNEFGQPVVEFREYGIQLEVEPIADRNGNILTHVKAAISSVDQGTTVNGVPGLITREADSIINIQSGETIVISGLLSTNDQRGVDKVPLLGDVPVVGGLFRSKRRIERRQELVVLVTPEVVSGPKDKISKDLAVNRQEMRKLLDSSIIDEELVE